MNPVIGVMAREEVKTWLKGLVMWLGYELISTAWKTILGTEMKSAIYGNNPTTDEGSSSSGGTTNDNSVNEVHITSRQALFDKDEAFYLLLIEICRSIYVHRKNINNSKADILYSLSTYFKNMILNQLIYDLIDSKNINVTEDANGKISLAFSEKAYNDIFEYCSRVFKSDLANFLGDIEEQVVNLGLPHRVLIHINQVMRSGTTQLSGKIITIPPTDSHVIYEAGKCERDIFGGELIYGKPAIIKMVDKVSMVAQYMIAKPGTVELDTTVDFDWNNAKDISTFITKLIPFDKDNTDLHRYVIPFNTLEKFIKMIYM